VSQELASQAFVCLCTVFQVRQLFIYLFIFL